MPLPFFRRFKIFLFLILASPSLVLAAFEPSSLPTVLVSVAPYKNFVEKIAKDTVKVHLMVPTGASAHTYEPTARQMMTASEAKIWFRIGESFEDRALQALLSHHPTLRVIDLRQGVDLIQSEHANGHKGCCPGSIDLHFWLSPRQAQIQVQTIGDALIKAFPEHTELYTKNLTLLINDLKKLDQDIESMLALLTNRNILVSHPAYAYFCRDYDLTQYSIEIEGKDPTPQQMTKLLNVARKLNLHTIFIQMQYNNKAAKLVAETIGAKLIILDPYSELYFTSMLEIAHAFANGS